MIKQFLKERKKIKNIKINTKENNLNTLKETIKKLKEKNSDLFMENDELNFIIKDLNSKNRQLRKRLATYENSSIKKKEKFLKKLTGKEKEQL